MTFDEYIEFTRTTWSNKGDDLLHAGVGLVGEVLELQQAKDDHHQQEELGDCLYYIARFYDLLSLPTSVDIMEVSKPIPLDSLAEQVLNQLKKRTFYDHTINVDDFSGLIQSCFFSIKCAVTPAEFLYLLESNRAKLQARYKNGFSSKAAELRADKGNTCFVED